MNIYRLLSYTFLYFYPNFNGLIKTHNFNCITDVKPYGIPYSATSYVRNLCYTLA